MSGEITAFIIVSTLIIFAFGLSKACDKLSKKKKLTKI